jgi:Tfp pilus assembly protein PilO
MIWREKKWLLVGLGAFLLANLLYFVTYRIRYEQRVADLDQRLEEAQDQLQKRRNGRAAAEQELLAYQDAVKDIDVVYGDWWSTSEQRLAPLIIEIRQLAARSQLTLRAINYDHTQQKNELGANFFGISFAVQGTYSQIRRLINLIELSRQFVIIDEISLSGDPTGSNVLQMNLRLKTLFRGTPKRTSSEVS